MQKPSNNISYEFIFAKLHGLWANAAKDERLTHLADSGSMDELLRQLAEYGVEASSRNVFHRNLMLREIRLLDSVADLLDQRMAGFYRAFIERVYFDNLKALLHDRFFPERKVPVEQLVVKVEDLPEIPLAELLKKNSPDDFLQTLRPALYPAEISAIVRKLFDDNDIMSADCELDKLAYRHMLLHAERTPDSVRSACTTLVKTEIDIVNLCMLMRVVRTYRLDETIVAAIWIDGGTLPPSQLTSLSGLETLSELAAKLPPAYRDLLRPFAEAELHVSEKTLWRMLYKQAKKNFADYNHMEQSIVAYPFLRHFETLNIGRIYEGIRFKMRPNEMQDMMICS